MSANERQAGGDHYTVMSIQPWDVIDTWPIDQQIGFYRGNQLKYTMRAGKKTGEAMLVEIEKANHYGEKLAEVLAKKKVTVIDGPDADKVERLYAGEPQHFQRDTRLVP